MNRIEILNELQRMFRETLLNDDLIITEETEFDAIEEWNSLTNMQVMIALEQKYGVKFGLRDIAGWSVIGDMIDSIIKKLSA